MQPHSVDKFLIKNVLAITALTTLFLVVVLYYWFAFNNSPEKITKKIQKHYSETEKSIIKSIGEIKSLLENNPNSVDKIVDTLNSDFQIYCFIKDTLISWNGNWLSYNDLSNIDCSDKLLRTSNGSYLVYCDETDTEVRLIGVQRIQNNYRYQNKYLQNGVLCKEEILENVYLSDTTTSYVIVNKYSQPVFYLKFDQNKFMNVEQYMIVLGAYVLFYIVFILLIFNILTFSFKLNLIKKASLFLGIIIVILVRIIQVRFKFPSIIYDNQVFGPQIFTFPGLAFSFGDFLLNVVSILVITRIIRLQTQLLKEENRVPRNLVMPGGFVLIFGYSWFMVSLLKAIIFDSVIPFNFNQIYNFNLYSIISILLISALIYAGYELISWLYSFYNWSIPRLKHIIIYISIGLVCFYAAWYFDIVDFHVFLFTSGLLILFIFWNWRNQSNKNTTLIVLYILLHSVLGSITIFSHQQNKEDNRQIMAASQLSADQRDPVVEYLFSSLEKRFERDMQLSQKLDSARENFDYPMIEKGIRDRYFSGYWTNFDIQLTICEPTDTLKLIPEKFTQNCYHYFQGLISDFGEPTSFSNLQFINYGPGDKSYLGSFYIKTNKKEYKIYAEITPKNYGSELGLPDLLVDENKGNDLLDISYSTALYINQVLYSHSGDYNYQNISNLMLPHGLNYQFMELDDYRHLYYKASEQKQIVVSRKNLNFFEKGATFTFLLLVFTAFFIFALQFRKGLFKLRDTGLQSQLQRFISSVLVLSFVFTGVFAVFYINQFNSTKVIDSLSEKTHSVMLEIQYKLASNQDVTITKDYFDELLVKFSSVFFSDINIYGLDGRLISTSRPQIFTEGIIGDQMNPDAFFQMTKQKKSFLIHNEQVGDLKFLSSYMPIKDINNEIIAYLNLPYFARQSELQIEVLAFLLRFVNIFLLILIASLALGFLLANYFSKPLQLLINNMKTVTLSGRNVVLEWKKKDEIGELISQYNQLLRELENSAKKLAVSERESAWREMARQIAHEIKNPLTPMKLSVQFLKKAWDDNDPKWEEKYLNFTSTMIEQIDALSGIASDFADFSKIKTNTIEPVNINTIARNAVVLFTDQRKHKIELLLEESIAPLVMADKDQILRLFNNILKNAVQAVEHLKDGRIRVQVLSDQTRVTIKISDNGIGIPAEIRDRIFQPNFTTKTGGMGLGLAIANAIAESFGGTIEYYPNHDSGTSFVVSFPLMNINIE